MAHKEDKGKGEGGVDAAGVDVICLVYGGKFALWLTIWYYEEMFLSWLYLCKYFNVKSMCKVKLKYRLFIKYCVFFLKILLFFLTLPVLLQCWCSTCLAHWHRGKTEKDQSPEYSKIFRKNTIFNEHPIYTLYSRILLFKKIQYYVTLSFWHQSSEKLLCFDYS